MNSDTATHGMGGIPHVLPKVQIHLRDSFPRREN